MTLTVFPPIPLTFVTVAKKEDFPGAVGGVITLANDTNYVVTGEVQMGTDRIVFGVRSAILGTNRVNDRLVFDTTGTAITASSGAISVILSEIALRCASGTLFSLADSSVAIIDCTIGPVATGGTVAMSDGFSFTFRNTGLLSGLTTTGFTFSGTTTGACRIFDNIATNNAGTVFNLGAAVFSVVKVSRNIVTSNAAQTYLAGTGSTNVTVGGQIGLNVFSGAGTAISGISNTDYLFTGNHGVTNTPASGTGTTIGGGMVWESDAPDDPMVIPGPAGAAGATGAPGPAGATGPAVYLDAEPGEDGQAGPPGIAGAAGSAGAQGVQGVPGVATFLEAEAGDDGAAGPPGVRGADGTAGSAGAQGAQGIPGVATFLEAEPGDEGMAGPPGVRGADGATGATGATGASGPAGPAVYLDAEPGEDGMIGPPGVAGAGSSLTYPITQPYNTGAFTVATGYWAHMVRRVQATALLRITLAGTARLSVSN